MTSKVWHVRDSNVPLDAVYVGRRSLYGNQYIIGVHGDRAEVIAKFRAWCSHNPWFVERVMRDLTGKDLVCHCAPLPCHADVLLEFTNEL